MTSACHTTLPIAPESIESARARFPAAVEEIYDAAAFIHDPSQRPAKYRKHVFDCEDGLRLIISTDRQPTGQVFLHASASLHGTTSEAYQHAMKLSIAASEGHDSNSQAIASQLEAFAKWIARRVNELAAFEVSPPRQALVTGGYIIHVFCDPPPAIVLAPEADHAETSNPSPAGGDDGQD